MPQFVQRKPLIFDRQPYPQPSWNKSPEEHQDSVAPVDDLYIALLFDGLEYLSGNILLIHQKRVVLAIVQQVGLDKARTYIGKGDVEMTHVCQLLQCFYIFVS